MVLDPAVTTYTQAHSQQHWVLAVTILAAIRLSRLQLEQSRLDPRRVLLSREKNRAMSKELRQKREQWKLEEAARLAGEDARRVQEAAQRAREEAKRHAEVQKRMREEAAAAAAKLTAERQAKKKEYEEQQAKLDAEYRQRVEKEQTIIDEARKRAAEEEERRRVAAEEERRRVERVRRREEEERRRQEEERVREKIEERKRLEKEKQKFAVRLEGNIVVVRPPPNTFIAVIGSLQKPATVRVDISAGSLLGGGMGDVQSFDYLSVEDALSVASIRQVASVIKTAADATTTALRLQAMTDSGPMATLEQPEQEHWMAVATARTVLSAVGALEQAVATFASSPSSPSSSTQAFQTRTEVGVLPVDHPKRPERVLGHAIQIIEQGEAAALKEVLHDVLAVENEAFYSQLSPLPQAFKSSPKTLGSALELAHFLDRTLHARPAHTSDAPAWFERTVSLVRSELRELVAGALPDSLEPYAAVLEATLGREHPVAMEAASLAIANISTAERARREEKERARQAELAAKLLEEEWPDAQEIRAARVAEREAKTPLAERVWALRNVAGTLGIGGPGERARARQLLEQAVQLKQQAAGAADHPSVLPELMALGELLEKNSEWQSDATGVGGLLLRVMGNISTLYSEENDGLSAALVMETALRRWEETAGVKSGGVRAATRRADQLVERLGEEEREVLGVEKRKVGEVLKKIVDGLTEELGAYQDYQQHASKASELDERGVLKVIGKLY